MGQRVRTWSMTTSCHGLKDYILQERVKPHLSLEKTMVSEVSLKSS